MCEIGIGGRDCRRGDRFEQERNLPSRNINFDEIIWMEGSALVDDGEGRKDGQGGSRQKSRSNTDSKGRDGCGAVWCGEV
jgi:hypothetical protein